MAALTSNWLATNHTDRPAAAPAFRPSETRKHSSWKLRVIVYSLSATLLTMAMGAVGDVIPDPFVRAERLFAGFSTAESAIATFNPDMLKMVKAGIWMRYRGQVDTCVRDESTRLEACMEQARRERKASLSEAKTRLQPRPHSAADRLVARY